MWIAGETAVGSFLGGLQDVSAVTLASTLAQTLLQGLDGKDVADVVVGNVLQAGQGMNPARQIALAAGAAGVNTRHDSQPGVRQRHAGRDQRGAGHPCG